MHVFMKAFAAFLVALAGLVFTAGSSLASSPLTIVYSGNNYGNYQPCPS